MVCAAIHLKPAKRYTLAVLFIFSQLKKALDDVAEIFIKTVRNLESTRQTSGSSNIDCDTPITCNRLSKTSEIGRLCYRPTGLKSG